MPDIKSYMYNLIHTCSLVCYQKNPTKNSTLKMQKQEKRECFSKRCNIFISFNIYLNLIVRFHILRYSKRCCKFGWIGYKCSVPGTNLIIKDAGNLSERFTFKFGRGHNR